MTIVKFLSDLKGLGVNIWVEDEQLRYRAPKGVITSNLKQELIGRKKDIIAFLQQAKIGNKTTDTVIEIVSRAGNLPLSFAQQRMWFGYQLDNNNPFYNESFQIEITGNLNISALEKSINEIVRRHEVLRTSFPTLEGKPLQQIHPYLKVNLPVIDVRGLPEAEVQEFIIKEARKPFNLSNGSLLRTTLLRLDSESYVLILIMHHIITDGWSMGVFFQELSTFYQDAISTDTTGGDVACNVSTKLPELPIQYADFAVWQRQYLTGELLEKQLNYWKQQLASTPPLLELPTDKPRPPIQTYNGAIAKFQLDQNLTKQLQTLSQKSGTTLFMTLLAAYNVLLYRYSNQEDICVGSPFANRNRREIESLIGFFTNTIVLRTQFKDNLSFSELLQQVLHVVLDAHTHQDVPFEQVVEALQPERSPSYNPLFQTMFVLENFSIDRFDLPEINLTPQLVERGTSQFDVSLSMWETREGLRGYWEYNTDLFESSTIDRMTDHFQTLLSAIVANPDCAVAELPILTEKERYQLLVEWNNTQTNYQQDKYIHNLFEEQVIKTPQSTAVVFEDESLTYQQLNEQANQLAHYLKTLGVKSEVMVGICVERSPLMIVGLLAILKAGGAFVPLDPAYPQERLDFMLKDSQIGVLLTQGSLVDKLPLHSAGVVQLDKDWDVISAYSQENPISEIKPENLAYVIYTSGSTGKPKGVLVPHEGLCNLIQEYIKVSQIGSDGRMLQFASFSFDASVVEIFMTIVAGATLVMATRESMMPGEPLLQILDDAAITTLNLPPSALAVLPFQPLPALQTIIVGGEACAPEVAAVWAKGRKFLNGYGPTEATIATTIAECTTFDGKLSIGYPLANKQVYILDKLLQPVPIGVKGEIYIGGIGLAKGYLNREDVTAERFIPHPFSEKQGERLYKTGDLGCYLRDGSIEFLGRIDNQVKIRGFRIELGEIEAVTTQHPYIREAAVTVREDKPGVKRLAAYVVWKQEKPTPQQLRQFLKEQLPEYMVPAYFTILDAFPITPNGKLDRRALPIPEIDFDDSSYLPPRTPTEEILAAIWCDVLGLKKVGINNNFFELGGDSIISIQIIARANQAGLKLTPKQLFQYQTIAELATVARKATTNVQAQQGLVTGEVPLTPIQHWFFEQNFVEPHHFNQAMLLEVPADIKPELLQQVLEKLLRYHDALRLQYIQMESRWQQINLDASVSVPLEVVDLSNLTYSEQKIAITHKANERQRVLNLSTGNLIQVVLFQLGVSSPGRLLIVIHHLAVDGVSWRILLEDLTTAYYQLLRGENIQLPAKTTSFKDWSSKLQDYAQEQKLYSELKYWLQNSHSFATVLPVDYTHDKSTNVVGSSQIVSVSLSKEQTRNLLQDVPSVYNTQINDVLLSALVQSFTRWAGCNSLLVNLEGHGREDLFEGVDLSRTVGWFTSVFPIQLKPENSIHPGETLKSIKEQLRQIPQRGIGYGILRYINRDSNIREQLQALPQPEISFNYLGQFDQTQFGDGWKFAQESHGEIHSALGKRSHLLEIDGLIINGRLQLDWRYSKNIHRQSTVETLANHYLQALEAIIAHCLSHDAGGYSPSDFPEADLSQDELDDLLSSIS